MDRHQQQRRIMRIRHGIVGGSAVGALALAGYLGAGAATATDEPGTATTVSDSSGTTPDPESSWSGIDGSSLRSGSGSSHAQTAGS